MKVFEFDEFSKVPCIGMYKEKEREIPIIEEVDVLIVGGSPSGVTAAIAVFCYIPWLLRQLLKKKKPRSLDLRVLFLKIKAEDLP